MSDTPFARMHHCQSSPDPAHAYWGVTCGVATLDFDDKTTAQLVTAALNAAYQAGRNRPILKSVIKRKKEA
jgi:hypothetical protein